MTDLPLVTIAIPTYNRVEYLKQALASAQAQTYPNLEIIVSDNASSDGTKLYLDEILDERVKTVRRFENIGGVRNMCLSLAEAKGEYLIILSDDDLIYPELVEIAVEDFKRFPDAAFWFCSTYIIDEFNDTCGLIIARSDNQTPLEHLKDWMTGRISVAFCGTVYKTSILSEIGGFPETPVLDAASRILSLQYGSAVSSSKFLSKYRRHSTSSTRSLGYRTWYELIEYLVDLIHIKFPNYYLKLMPIIPSYMSRSLLSTLIVGDWQDLIYCQRLLYEKYGFRTWFQFKFFSTVFEFLFPKASSKFRKLYNNKKVYNYEKS